jgi:hypothetical protein
MGDGMIDAGNATIALRGLMARFFGVAVGAHL